MVGHVIKENLTKDESFMVMCLHWLSKRYSNKQYELVWHSEEISNTGMYGDCKVFYVCLKNKKGNEFEFEFLMNEKDYNLYDHFDLNKDFDRLLEKKWRINKLRTFVLKEKSAGIDLLKAI